MRTGRPTRTVLTPGSGWVYTDERIGDTTFFFAVRWRRTRTTSATSGTRRTTFAPLERPRVYEKVGKYNRDRRVRKPGPRKRLYEVGDFVHIDRLLYFTSECTQEHAVCAQTNAQIQSETVALYDRTLGLWPRPGRPAAGSHKSAWSHPRRRPRMVTSSRCPIALTPNGPSGSPGRQRWCHKDDRPTAARARPAPPHFNECYRVLPPRRFDNHAHAFYRRPGNVPGPQPRLVLEREQFLVPHAERSPFCRPGADLSPADLRVHTGYPTCMARRTNHPLRVRQPHRRKDGPRQGGPLLSMTVCSYPQQHRHFANR